MKSKSTLTAIALTFLMSSSALIAMNSEEDENKKGVLTKRTGTWGNPLTWGGSVSVPNWNHELKFEGDRPHGWSVSLPKGATEPFNVSSLGKGHIQVTGPAVSGLYYRLDLTNLVGQEVIFTASVKSSVPNTYIEFWGKKEMKRVADINQTDWQDLSVKLLITAGDSVQKLYIGAGRKGSYEVKSVDLTIAP